MSCPKIWYWIVSKEPCLILVKNDIEDYLGMRIGGGLKCYAYCKANFSSDRIGENIYLFKIMRLHWRFPNVYHYTALQYRVLLATKDFYYVDLF